MTEKEIGEQLKGKLFNKKENGWRSVQDKTDIFNYANGYIQFMNASKTEREIIKSSKTVSYTHLDVYKRQGINQ